MRWQQSWTNQIFIHQVKLYLMQSLLCLCTDSVFLLRGRRESNGRALVCSQKAATLKLAAFCLTHTTEDRYQSWHQHWHWKYWKKESLWRQCEKRKQPTVRSVCMGMMVLSWDGLEKSETFYLTSTKVVLEVEIVLSGGLEFISLTVDE